MLDLVLKWLHYNRLEYIFVKQEIHEHTVKVNKPIHIPKTSHVSFSVPQPIETKPTSTIKKNIPSWQMIRFPSTAISLVVMLKETSTNEDATIINYAMANFSKVGIRCDKIIFGAHKGFFFPESTPILTSITNQDVFPETKFITYVEWSKFYDCKQYRSQIWSQLQPFIKQK